MLGAADKEEEAEWARGQPEAPGSRGEAGSGDAWVLGARRLNGPRGSSALAGLGSTELSQGFIL